MLKFISLISIAGFTFLTNPSNGEISKAKYAFSTDQDSLWTVIDSNIVRYGKLFHNDYLNNDERAILRENYLRRIRIEGLTLWKGVPNDKRQIRWLLFTVSNPPTYYNYEFMQFDLKEKEQWDKIYPAIRSGYMSYLEQALPKEDHVNDKFCFEVSELSSDLLRQKYIFMTTGKKFDLTKYAEPMIELARKADSHLLLSFLLHETGDQIFRDVNDVGLNDKEIFSFLDTLKKAGIPELTAWADGKNEFLKLRETPLQLSFYTYDNKLVNINQLRGKVVLIDFWATWCSVCLDYMPSVKRVYDKYHSKGLEVISISVNKATETKQVLATEKKQNVSWPLGIIGSETLKNQIWKQFGFTSVPQVLLLDKSGRLIESNGRLMNKNTLDEMVKQALN